MAPLLMVLIHHRSVTSRSNQGHGTPHSSGLPISSGIRSGLTHDQTANSLERAPFLKRTNQFFSFSNQDNSHPLSICNLFRGVTILFFFFYPLPLLWEYLFVYPPFLMLLQSAAKFSCSSRSFDGRPEEEEKDLFLRHAKVLPKFFPPQVSEEAGKVLDVRAHRIPRFCH